MSDLENELNGHLRNLQHGTILLEEAYELLKTIAERLDKDPEVLVSELKSLFQEFKETREDGKFPQELLEKARDAVFKFFDCNSAQGLSLAIGGLIHVEPNP